MLLTLIARASDGQLLSGSIQEAEEVRIGFFVLTCLILLWSKFALPGGLRLSKVLCRRFAVWCVLLIVRERRKDRADGVRGKSAHSPRPLSAACLSVTQGPCPHHALLSLLSPSLLDSPFVSIHSFFT